MNLEGIMLCEISQSEKDKYHMWNLRNKTHEQTEKKRQTKRQLLKYREQAGGLPKGR